jgi:HPt (histidine-containing phosphotransfer) domain-containing protein
MTVNTVQAGDIEVSDPPLRFDLLCHRVMDDREMALELLGAAVGRLDQDLAAIRNAVDRRETKAAKDLAHRLKGTAGNLSAEPLRRACGQLEITAAAEQIESLGHCFGQVDLAAECFRAAAKTLLKASYPPAASARHS